MAWRRPCVSFAVNGVGAPKLQLSSDEARALASLAFSRWTGAACGGGKPSIEVWDLSPAACSRVEYFPDGPNANLIVFREQDWAHGALTAALTSVTFTASTGEIVDADLEINVVDFAPTREFLEYILTHEAGHFFGMAHSEEPETIMAPSYVGVMDDLAILGLDDVVGICSIYPPGQDVAATCDPQPAQGYASDCGGDVEGGCSTRKGASAAGGQPPTLLLLLALCWVRRRFAHTQFLRTQ